MNANTMDENLTMFPHREWKQGCFWIKKKKKEKEQEYPLKIKNVNKK